MTFEFHPDALTEYEEAGIWYEERRWRLGLEFADVVEAGIAAILETPDKYPPANHQVRVFRLKRFPFYIFYVNDAAKHHVKIVAIMHHKRRPDYWRDRL